MNTNTKEQKIIECLKQCKEFIHAVTSNVIYGDSDNSIEELYEEVNQTIEYAIQYVTDIQKELNMLRVLKKNVDRIIVKYDD